MKKIGIIGAGFTGMTAAKQLLAAGCEVTIIEKEGWPGGLAAGFTDNNWDWPLESHYHHVFTTDKTIISLAGEIGVSINFYHPLTATYYLGIISQLDSPLSLLKFSALSFPDRLRTGLGLAMLKYNPFWQIFENLTAKTYITRVMGQASWKIIWEPLFTGKFGKYADQVSATWFWARIFTRTQSLGYPDGGFAGFADKLAEYLKTRGAVFLYRQSVSEITQNKSGVTVILDSGKQLQFDQVLCTLPNSVFTKVTPGLPAGYVNSLNSRPGLGAVTLILSLKEKFLPGVYWLNINDRSMPFLALVEHTNLIKNSHYHGENLLYIGNYLPADHKYFSKDAGELVREFTPYLKKINSEFSEKNIIKSWVWKAAFAQPVFTPGSAKNLPGISTPVPGLYLANIQQVYPWDRGTNYAVELGYRAAAVIQK
jgi:protoporphyrinogen oxidase